MSRDATALKEHLRLVGEAKARAHAEDLAWFNSLPLSERLGLAMRHCGAGVRAHGTRSIHDDEAETWHRVRTRIAGARR